MSSSILYVDSDHEATLVLPHFLKRAGSFRAVETLSAARTAIAQELPALIVIDPSLPDGDGTELIAQVRAWHSWVQIFVIPGPGFTDQIAALIAAGANDVAMKPFDVGRLSSRLESLLRAAESARREMVYRQQLESRLQHVGRIATLGTLCATIAHEIANPLTLISADIEAVSNTLSSEDSLDGPERLDLREAMSEMGVAARLIQTLVQRIRAFSRRDERRRVTESLEPIVDTALLLLKPRFAARGILVHRPRSAAPVLPHYPIRLTQALLNLLTNAIEAVDAGGNIVLRYLEEPGAFGVAVDDDGPGISDDLRVRVTEPFFTSKVDGTGLGLLLVRTIMREHEGRFDLLPGPGGRGASARLLLPRTTEDRVAGRI